MRESGLYWITYEGINYIGLYKSDTWQIFGAGFDNKQFIDKDFTYIGEETITLEKYNLMASGYKMLESFRKASQAYEQFLKQFKPK